MKVEVDRSFEIVGIRKFEREHDEGVIQCGESPHPTSNGWLYVVKERSGRNRSEAKWMDGVGDLASNDKYVLVQSKLLRRPLQKDTTAE